MNKLIRMGRASAVTRTGTFFVGAVPDDGATQPNNTCAISGQPGYLPTSSSGPC
jgi:hypothetical protein